ncbi:hypothetical protein J2Z32_001695 [Paenibacillus turicensis]|uniref:Uncharacterized protein n=1 Tax=Paenibacillus turicensis TaxID=160487 RepID=A0ABS4FR65_9BACL|nr:hypothetical protein [Paenibacillus turicensis]
MLVVQVVNVPLAVQTNIYYNDSIKNQYLTLLGVCCYGAEGGFNRC